NSDPIIYVPPPATPETSVNSGSKCEIPSADAALPRFSLNGFKGRQTHRIIFWGEKASLAEVVEPIAKEIGGEMLLNVGESGDTHIYEAAKRIAEDGRPAVILYFSDFDPSGWQMPISVGQKLRAMRDLHFPDIKFKLHKVAMTQEQVRELGLPSSPLKYTEKRAQKWREAMGHEQTEIDAMVGLHPEALRAAICEAIRPYYDNSLATRVLQAEAMWLRDARAALEANHDYQAGKDRIEDARQVADDAAIEMNEEQAKLAQILETSVPPVPDLPKAEPEGLEQQALVDSDEDFVTASQRLQRHKALDDDDE
ncbi:MAG: hypothetical protein ACJ8AH_02030, partial [Stellaceae bacterium]